MYECRCNERLKSKDEGSIRLTYTWLDGGLEHGRFDIVKGECVICLLFLVSKG